LFRTVGEASVFDASTVISFATKSEGSKEKDKDKRKDEDKDFDSDEGKEKLSRKPVDVHKWGIKFSGVEGGASVLSFLADVEEKANWKRIDVNCLVAAASEFFEGAAKTWFRSVKSKIDSWKELKILIRKEFLPLDYYDSLWEEIRNRKQGINESIGAYVANTIGLFEWLELGEVVTEEMKLKIIQKNVAPFYMEKLALMPIHSLEEMKTYGKQLEVNKQRVEVYEGPKSKAKPLAPEFAYKPSGRKPVVHEVVTPPSASTSSEKCWKCESEGHLFSSCDKEQKFKFCYRCGKKGETTKSCPKCSKSPGKGKGPSSKGSKPGE